MPTPTKVVVHFDDGSTYETPAKRIGSIFMSEAGAKKCGHKPPWGVPPAGPVNNATSGDATMPTASADAEVNEAGQCYYVNGVIICP